MKIKALSLWEPWATLMRLGAKTIETRSWPTSYRGPLLWVDGPDFPDRPAPLAELAEELITGNPASRPDPELEPLEIPF